VALFSAAIRRRRGGVLPPRNYNLGLIRAKAGECLGTGAKPQRGVPSAGGRAPPSSALCWRTNRGGSGGSAPPKTAGSGEAEPPQRVWAEPTFGRSKPLARRNKPIQRTFNVKPSTLDLYLNFDNVSYQKNGSSIFHAFDNCHYRNSSGSFPTGSPQSHWKCESNDLLIFVDSPADSRAPGAARGWGGGSQLSPIGVTWLGGRVPGSQLSPIGVKFVLDGRSLTVKNERGI